jgi:hypothetical protein
MPGSLARPPRVSTGARRRRRRLTGVLTEEHDGELWWRHGGAAAVVAPGHPLAATPMRRRRRAHGRAQHGTAGGVGVAVAVQPTQSRGDHHQSRRAQGGAPASSPEQIEPLGLDPQWQSSGAMSAMGGDADESQRSGDRAHRAEAEAPESSGESRRSSPELGEGRVGGAVARAEIGLGFRPGA